LGNWHEGLPYLTHVANKDIRDAALLELDAAPKKPAQQIAVGEKWRRAAQSHEGMERECLMLRAILWHRRARSRLDEGSVRAKLDQRLEEMLQEIDRLAALPRAFPMIYPLSRVGYWSPSFAAKEPKVLHWDVTPFLTHSGRYALWLQCGNVAGPLRVEWVVFGRDGKDGKEISRHANPSVAEGGKPWPQYTIALEAPEPGEQYGLYARVAGGEAAPGMQPVPSVPGGMPGPGMPGMPPPGSPGVGASASAPSYGCLRMKYLGPQMPAPSSPAP
jgi:hypothetical protein